MSNIQANNEATQQNQQAYFMSLIDAKCRVEQAGAALSVWLEATAACERDVNMIGAVMSLLEGVAEAMAQADSELANDILLEHREGKS